MQGTVSLEVLERIRLVHQTDCLYARCQEGNAARGAIFGIGFSLPLYAGLYLLMRRLLGY